MGAGAAVYRPNTVEYASGKFFEKKKFPNEISQCILAYVGNEPCSRLQIMLANSHALNQAIQAQLVQRTRELQETRATLEMAQREIGRGRDLVEWIDHILDLTWGQIYLGAPVTRATTRALLERLMRTTAEFQR